MASCILTVIKNEQEYLDEWIRYHLNLGIDHIFIFEDIDSDSHKYITDKYKDNVTLNSILIVLNNTEKEKAFFVKEIKKWNVQHIYIKNALLYLRDNFGNLYNWCFVIDNDEFITLENNCLNNIFDLYKNYDAFIIRWKCYGSNGLINKPNYLNKGLIETYINESIINDYIPKLDIDSWCKTCYNLKSFKDEYFFNQHHPNNKCNWCNTDYIKNTNFKCKNIYLRHYITKSWEEYVSKIRQRGFTWGGSRDFDFFFKVNPEMNIYKEQLLKEIKKEILVVIPYKQSKSQGNEIKLSLNTWKKFCKFKYHFIVIGEFNEQLKDEFPWVEFIKCQSIQKIEGQYNPHLDINNKFNIIYKKYGNAYDRFIYMTDDEYAIKPFNLEDIEKIYYHSSNFIGRQDQPTSYWNHDKWKTKQLLIKENLPTINYTTHYPCFFEFKKFNEIQKKFNMLNESYVFDDIYFNYFKHEEPILDNEIRLGIWNKKIFDNEFQKAIENPNIKFVCNSVEGWSKELENELEKIIKN